MKETMKLYFIDASSGELQENSVQPEFLAKTADEVKSPTTSVRYYFRFLSYIWLRGSQSSENCCGANNFSVSTGELW